MLGLLALAMLLILPLWLKFWESVVRPYFEEEPEQQEGDDDARGAGS